MADLRMGMETSGAWITNKGLLAAVQERLDYLPVSGIVWHVLKGQIEYDFELPKIEALASEYDVPVIRLETDYQQQDVEQLRIRLEAFGEMLRQRNQERMRIAQ
jgi:benzoyl-CoA reductase/2-hydroxyglutaryl-CoA dehydratase subunit BcrC/BadD/HgdB